ncbi:transporter substrate-binding domain-containing protein [Pseudomonas sp. RIT-PI-S]|uniref:substrate-binding periplasmic protein n=1 Tax=Pseudomonas sp. RIT-PI-S TaxID=3035295 RepID=UPI0021DA3446|nr:transporter substrate-binding domain-containing protein [Pseudomonas sp. RIT-PI-S]
MLIAPGSGWSETLRLVADPWPPFSDARMEGGGLATAIVSMALERAGYSVHVDEVPWARALLGIGDGRYDVLVDAWYTAERARLGKFSSGYLTNRVRFIRRRDSNVDFSNGLQGLAPYPIAVVRGYAYSPDFDNATQLQKVPVQNFAAAITMLLGGRVKLAIEDEYVATYQLNQEPLAVRNQVELLEPPLAENSLHILVSLKHPEHDAIVTGFDQAIAAMRDDGSLARLFKRYGL